MGRQWMPSEIHQLVKRYPNEGPSPIAATLERSVNSVCSQARRYGVHSESRRHRQAASRAANNATVNPRFFESNSSAVPFVLGFIWACGSLKTRRRLVLRLSCDAARVGQLRNALKLPGGKRCPPLPMLQIAEAGLEQSENTPGKTAPVQRGRAKSDVNSTSLRRLTPWCQRPVWRGRAANFRKETPQGDTFSQPVVG